MSQSQLIFLVFTVITLILMNPSIINVNVTSASIAFHLDSILITWAVNLKCYYRNIIEHNCEGEKKDFLVNGKV